MASRDEDSGPTNKKDPVAVALKYDKDKEPAPHVVATGRGYIAQQIIALAKEQGITVHEDAELVEILSVLDIGTIIPLEAYTAVAEILAYVYRTNRRTREAKTSR